MGVIRNSLGRTVEYLSPDGKVLAKQPRSGDIYHTETNKYCWSTARRKWLKFDNEPKIGEISGRYIWDGKTWIELQKSVPTAKHTHTVFVQHVCTDEITELKNSRTFLEKGEYRIYDIIPFGEDDIMNQKLPLKKREDLINVNLRGYDPPLGTHAIDPFKDRRDRVWEKDWWNSEAIMKDSSSSSILDAKFKAVEAAKEISKKFNEQLKTIKMHKKLIGYRLKNESHRGAVNALMGMGWLDKDWMLFGALSHDFFALDKIKEAGVLDLWFDQVYDIAEKTGWYIEEKSDWLMYYNFETGKRFGWTSVGEWHEDDTANIHKSGARTPADEVQVLRRFEHECKKRGIEPGVEFTSPYSGEKFTASGGLQFQKHNAQVVLRCGDGIVFYNGKWAEVVKESLPEFCGYEAEESDDLLEWGCYIVKKKTLREMREMGITSFNLIHGREKIKVGKNNTKRIFDYVQKQYDNGN